MIYNLANNGEAIEALAYLAKLTNKKHRVDIKKISPNRSLNQNSYLHLIISYFGSQTGYLPEEAKAIYKRVNSDIYVYRKNGMPFVRSSADLTKDEMAKSIDRFMLYAAEQGYPLPPAENAEWLSLAANEIEQARF